MKMEVLRRSSVFAAEVMEVFDRTPTDKELVSQAKVLCRDYIHSRLNRAGIGWNKPDHSAPVPGGKLAEVSNILLRLGDELEYIRPNLYRNVARQLNISLHSETVVTDAFLAVATQIFSSGAVLQSTLWVREGEMRQSKVSTGKASAEMEDEIDKKGAKFHFVKNCQLLTMFIRAQKINSIRRSDAGGGEFPSVAGNPSGPIAEKMLMQGPRQQGILPQKHLGYMHED